MTTNIREKVLNLIKEKTNLDHLHAKDFEIGIYNWCIKHAEEHQIIKNWQNAKFTTLYLEKSRSILSNIDKTSYIGNERLLKRLKEKEFLPHDIPFMKPDNVFPDRWKETIEAYLKKYENAYENKAVAMTDMFTCGKCKKKECTYYEMFSRSADEPAVIHIRCINCGNSWKIG
jgi:DNA-directed RNA polymerase subunit M/transcription elongation factor TFIIS